MVGAYELAAPVVIVEAGGGAAVGHRPPASSDFNEWNNWRAFVLSAGAAVVLEDWVVGGMLSYQRSTYVHSVEADFFAREPRGDAGRVRVFGGYVVHVGRVFQHGPRFGLNAAVTFERELRPDPSAQGGADARTDVGVDLGYAFAFSVSSSFAIVVEVVGLGMLRSGTEGPFAFQAGATSGVRFSL